MPLPEDEELRVQTNSPELFVRAAAWGGALPFKNEFGELSVAEPATVDEGRFFERLKAFGEDERLTFMELRKSLGKARELGRPASGAGRPDVLDDYILDLLDHV